MQTTRHATFTLILATVLLAVFGSGCSEFDLRTGPSPDGIGVPDIVVTPPALEFGVVDATGQAVRQFEIRNVGDAPLTVDDITIEATTSFTILSSVRWVLGMDEATTIDVAFTPMQADENFGQALVHSDDPDSPSVPVDLLGHGAVPELIITPSEHDFGQAVVPCGDTQELTLENVGLEPLELTAISYTSDSMLSLVDTNALPMWLDPGQITTVDVVFDALALGTVDGVLAVDSNDPRGVVTATQHGEAVYGVPAAEQFVVPLDPAVDIMFVVDQSCSMDTEATALANAFSIFINEIENETQGWQIGVATLFDGCFNSGVLTANTPTYQTLFSAAVTLGTHHARTEALLELADVALGETGAGQCNANFLRPGALLHIIVVSDESEQSGVAWDTWLSSYEAYVTDPSLVKVSAVADLNTACGDGSGAAGYIDAAGATSGLTLDICTAAWSSQVGQLAQASLTAIADFTLTGTPDPATITVMVDGVPTTDWTYDPMSNAVQVGGTLAGGEVVDVSYSSWGVCP